MFKLLKQENNARRGVFHTVHGDIQTPVFMNVGTIAAIKGAVSAMDLKDVNCQVELSNTYHLHLRPGDKVVKALGGLHKFMNWDRPILTDSGGFQVFSLAQLNKISDEGVVFASHIDGRKIFMGPKESMQIQSNLASTIAMAFDECVNSKVEKDYAKIASMRTVKWLKICKEELQMLNQRDDTINPHQLLFGINQGAIFSDLRIENMKAIADLDLPGYAIGGLAVGESHAEMYETIEKVEPYMPKDKPRYLMGVGTPANIIESVARGIDFFDCVIASRNARHGNLYTKNGIMNLLNAKYELDDSKIDKNCNCPTCQNFSRAYLRHLFKAKEMLGMRLCVLHNLYFYNELMSDIRFAIEEDRFDAFRQEKVEIYSRKI